MTTHVESAKDRRVAAHEAGFGATSVISVVAGVLVAFGTLALLGAATGAIGSQLGLRTEGIDTDEWRQAGIGGTILAAAALFLAFFLGGYTAGRMARRAGARHGMLVFVLSAVVVGVIVLLTALWGDVAGELRDADIPTDANTWDDIALGAAIAGVVAMLAGSLVGGVKGEHWHGRLADLVDEHRRETQPVEVAAATPPPRRLFRLRPTPKGRHAESRDLETRHADAATTTVAAADTPPAERTTPDHTERIDLSDRSDGTEPIPVPVRDEATVER